MASDFEEQVNAKLKEWCEAAGFPAERLSGEALRVLVSKGYTTLTRLAEATWHDLIAVGISPGTASLLKAVFPWPDDPLPSGPSSTTHKSILDEMIDAVRKLLPRPAVKEHDA
mmetsp:Transcript_3413/g.7429  ORF Transcript_3413/g.7429 Transcript_3413/m.7429 type:complete len:113 (+) Transcript_3413:245-583(+)|eukprot:CAMPEP_0202893864 /NCGR_PEP_ID=MMETSP1392-20130828/3364_1 /ASSEMBLY_ACC=CAM_ASM_000868 /TAXON_ID=225041 /ORGANISM="Chlamydomonas chlamydogama, Strain SAG 11-48b" /LENGTH=112 /DNA_ID=CAMNT_0049578351 /DNA_START=244 /DNA_END=582 /DNA_ORIENTATION=-